jgi:hypothetical protein
MWESASMLTDKQREDVFDRMQKAHDVYRSLNTDSLAAKYEKDIFDDGMRMLVLYTNEHNLAEEFRTTIRRLVRDHAKLQDALVSLKQDDTDVTRTSEPDQQ